ncbi:MAG: hypothetical protein SFW67_27770 [Myxococcaceae bacterium]|nr:hypothetical protein [Myxococcaceae bacterium]
MELLTQPTLWQRVLTFLRSRPTEAFSLLEIIEAVEPMPAHQIALIAASERARGIKGLLDRYEAVLDDLQNDPLSGCPVISGEHGGVRYFGLREGQPATEPR